MVFMFLCIVMGKSVKKSNSPWSLDGFVMLERVSSGVHPTDSFSGLPFSWPF